MIITIDGPAGAGKSTISKRVAQRLGFLYLDTGAMYRACALHVIRSGVKTDDEKLVISCLNGIKVSLEGDRVLLNSENVADKIRTPEIDQAASAISRIGAIRDMMTRLQRTMAMDKNIVAEGRDMGTVVFPNAQLKIFLTATPEERARRRQAQLREQGQILPFEIILHQIKNRDKADMNRDIAPLRAADDAVIIDTTNMAIEDILKKIIELAKKVSGANDGLQKY